MASRLFTSRTTRLASAIVSMGIALILLALWMRETRSVDIYVLPERQTGAKPFCTEIHIREAQGVRAQFTFQGEVDNAFSDVHQVRLEIQSIRETGKIYPYDIRVNDNRVFSENVPLGSDQWPLTQDEDYTFELKELDHGRTLLQGKLLARVTQVPGWVERVLLLLSAVASILQIGAFIGDIPAKPRSYTVTERDRRKSADLPSA